MIQQKKDQETESFLFNEEENLVPQSLSEHQSRASAPNGL